MLTSNHYLIVGCVILVLFYLFIRHQVSCIIDEKIEKSHKKIIKKIYSMYKKFNQHEQSQQEYQQQQYYQNNAEAELTKIRENQYNNEQKEHFVNKEETDDSIEDIGFSGNQGNEYASFSN